MKTISGLLLLLLTVGAGAYSNAAPDSVIVLDDFESDRVGEHPAKWRYLSNRNRRFQAAGPQMAPNETFLVAAERGNRFVRAYTEGEAQRISLPNSTLEWKLSDHPRLRWSWRANRLPAGAREDRVNDSGGAVYVSFSKTDWLGRPLSIKYVYSSSLPVGTDVSTGNVKIIVVSSGRDEIGKWVAVERNVVDDYARLFGGTPPDEPFTITLWSDSDDTKSVGEVDFDDIELAR